MLPRCMWTLAASSCLCVVWLAMPPRAAGQQAINDATAKAQYDGLLAKYEARIAPAIVTEANRTRGGAEPSQEFWDQVFAFRTDFDTEFLPLLQAINRVDTAAALRLYFRWLRAEQLRGGPDTTVQIVQQIQAAAPTVKQAVQFVLDTLVRNCNEANAMEAAPALEGAYRAGALTGFEPPADWAQKYAACANKAVLLLDFDSSVEGRHGVNGYPTSQAHVRANRVKLRYNAATDEFVAEGFPAEYLSYDYTIGPPPLKCETARPVSGTLRAYATMTKKEGEPAEYLVQLFPEVSEDLKRIQRPSVANPMQGILQHRTDNACDHLQNERGREHWAGFSDTEGAAPVRIKLGDSDIELGKPWDMGEVHYTGNVIIRLYRP